MQQAPAKSDLVFPSRLGVELSDMTLSALMKRMHHSDKIGYVDKRSGRAAVPHGIRSTFRDWAAENRQPRDAVELQRRTELVTKQKKPTSEQNSSTSERRF